MKALIISGGSKGAFTGANLSACKTNLQMDNMLP